jgi:hypothetical protein
VTVWDEQVAADAERVNGVPTSLPDEGLLTITPAYMGAARIVSDEARRETFLSILMQTTERRRIMSSPQREI